MSPSPSPRRRAELEQRLSRQDHAILGITVCLSLGLRLVPGHGHEREAMAVRRDEAHFIAAKNEERAVEEIPRVLTGDRKLRLLDHLLDGIPAERRADSPARFRHRRKILAGKRLHPRIETIGRNLDAVLVLLDPHVRFRQRLHDLVEFLRRQRDRSTPGDRRRARASQSNLQVGREQLDLIALRLEQHIREDRNRVLALDDPLEELQFAQQIGLADDQFHVAVTSRESAGAARRSLN